MGFLSKDDINKADDLKHEDVSVPEWGGTVRLLMLTGTQRDDFEMKSIDQRAKDQKLNLVNFRARLLSLCLVDQENRRLFSDVEVPLLGQKAAPVLERLFDKARSMNGMSEEDVEELTEGFESDPNELSITD